MIAETHNARELIESYIGGNRNFRNANLSGLELKRTQLPEIDLQGAYLRWADFQGANLKLANLAWADLQKANLSDVILQQAMLKEAKLRKVNLQWADLQGAQLQGANLFHSHLMCANFRGASLRLANLEAADLDKAELTGADLRVANLIGAKLRNADLKQAKLQGANLQYANLTGANLEGVNLQGADLTGARLFGANLTGANLQQVNLEGVDLTEAKLFGANFQEANLERTILPSLENMQGACLKKAQLVGSILPKGQMLEPAMLTNGLIAPPPNVTKSLPASSSSPSKSEMEAPELMPVDPDDAADEQNAAISEAQTDLSLDLSVDSSSKNIQSNSDRSPELDRQNLPPESEPIVPTFDDRETADMMELNLSSSDEPEKNQLNSEPQELLTIIQQRMGTEGHFTSTSLAIAKRRGPSKFRQQLLEAYNRCCSITGCDVEPILEVAFLEPNLPDRHSDPANALLLRADIHTLFDLHLIAIDPETMKIIVAPSLRNSNYGAFHGQSLRPASLAAFKPSQTALKLRLQWCSWLDASA